MPRQAVRVVTFLLLASTCLVLAVYFATTSQHGDTSIPPPQSPPPTLNTTLSPLGPPQPGEWRYTFHEEPQSFEQYVQTVAVRPNATRKAIVFQPLGILDDDNRRVLEKMRAYAEIFFQLPTRVERPLPLEGNGGPLWRMMPRERRTSKYDRQYDGDKIMAEILEKHIPDDAIAYLGLTMEDLYSGDLNYVFGVATLERHVGVYSLCRYYPAFWGEAETSSSEVDGLRRACKLLNHETGHMFGLKHCLFYHCSMNGSNSLPETDAAPIHFCPVCEQKLAWNIGFDPQKQHRELEAFYRENGLKDEADWMAALIQNSKR